MSGYQFTWEKGKGTSRWIEERLDKVLATNDWCGIVPDARVSNVLTRTSDHSAIFLAIRDYGVRGGGGRKRFRFEMAWLYDEGCRTMVAKSWEEGRNEGTQNCIRHCGNRLAQWGGDHYHRFGEKIMQLRKEQQYLKGRTGSASLAEFQRLEEALSHMETQKDVYWKQRAKQHWLKDVDTNTKFYHRYASHRKRKNTLSRLMNDYGDWVEREDMKCVILEYFKKIFSSSNPMNGEPLFDR
ncbi:PREDICTED: uncharacterized protein LOC109155046 [Ipomoea nil]|uniref:uncharacterized protein LOC109155046 n=1 Tax=Ipomoea nil TaxID=35883 RepID=UPI000900F230|nr:PREDICTED: uncharacterized protein LOC109155046 [Ipomoea nil]